MAWWNGAKMVPCHHRKLCLLFLLSPPLNLNGKRLQFPLHCISQSGPFSAFSPENFLLGEVVNKLALSGWQQIPTPLKSQEVFKEIKIWRRLLLSSPLTYLFLKLSHTSFPPRWTVESLHKSLKIQTMDWSIFHWRYATAPSFRFNAR